MNAPAKYRKRPVVIEAMQWAGDNAEQIIPLGWDRQRQIEFEPAGDPSGVHSGR